jgi:hypothetical protein
MTKRRTADSPPILSAGSTWTMLVVEMELMVGAQTITALWTRRTAVAIESDKRNTHHTDMIRETVGGMTNEYDKENAFCYSRHDVLSYDPDS